MNMEKAAVRLCGLQFFWGLAEVSAAKQKLPPERENFRPREKTSARERKLPPERENFRPREKTSARE
ncbi:hypothetical protein, partial [Lentibacillus sediminis]|uniref:hypothetical protein n=1 Tax=Lentibacillus sediminis TaxID=1940529 RepID=UPI00195E6429